MSFQLSIELVSCFSLVCLSTEGWDKAHEPWCSFPRSFCSILKRLQMFLGDRLASTRQEIALLNSIERDKKSFKVEGRFA
jgi:hypothetical protein